MLDPVRRVPLNIHTAEGDLHAALPGFFGIPARGDYLQIGEYRGRVERIEWIYAPAPEEMGLEEWRVELWLVDMEPVETGQR